MKVERVILSSNNNEMYYPFWNVVSKIWKTKFGIEPVLIFIGTEEEKNKCDLSDEYGQIIINDLPIEGKLAWECTWALFYYTKFFPEDTCIIMGIDQIPTGTFFLKDSITHISDDSYVMLTDDAYENTPFGRWDIGGISPTAYHIAKGKLFNDIYKFEETFEEEIKKINSMNLTTMWGKETGNNKWGYDETYSSKVLYQQKNKFKIIGLSLNKEFNTRRIDCFRNVEVPYNLEALKSNYYIECHSCRPYKDHKKWIDDLSNNIPFFI
jgi:hypothetical protein